MRKISDSNKPSASIVKLGELNSRDKGFFLLNISFSLAFAFSPENIINGRLIGNRLSSWWRAFHDDVVLAAQMGAESTRIRCTAIRTVWLATIVDLVFMLVP
jgi:hypothetical protein